MASMEFGVLQRTRVYLHLTGNLFLFLLKGRGYWGRRGGGAGGGLHTKVAMKAVNHIHENDGMWDICLKDLQRSRLFTWQAVIFFMKKTERENSRTYPRRLDERWSLLFSAECRARSGLFKQWRKECVKVQNGPGALWKAMDHGGLESMTGWWQGRIVQPSKGGGEGKGREGAQACLWFGIPVNTQERRCLRRAVMLWKHFWGSISLFLGRGSAMSQKSFWESEWGSGGSGGWGEICQITR